MKVLIINKSGCRFTVNMDKNTLIYPHFKLWELANNQGDSKQPQMILSPAVDDLMQLVEALRCWWNKPMTCSSCFRQRAFNKKIGGAVNSLHLEALAFDWNVKLTYALRVAVYQQWRSLTRQAGKIGGINFYPWGVHLDANEEHFGHKSFIIRDGNKIVNEVPQ